KWQEKAIVGFIDPEDRKKGLERLELYKNKKPCRIEKDGSQAAEPDAAPTDAPDKEQWAGFPDPELAKRVFAELDEPIGKLAEGTNTHDRRLRARRMSAIQEDIARKHHLKPREVEEIWRAGKGADPTDRP